MSFRNTKRDSESDNSDDEGPSVRKMARDEGVHMEHAQMREANKKHNVWADVVFEQQLDEVGAVHMEDKKARIDRGPESFVIPAEEVKELNEKTRREKEEGYKNQMNMPVVTVSPVVEDPFADAVDIREVEAFGFDDTPSISTGYIKRNDFYAGGRLFKGGQRPPSYHVGNKSLTNDDRKGGGRENGNNGFGGRGGDAKTDTGRGNKRNWVGQNVLRKIIAPGYSLEALMAAEFDEGISVEELGEQIAKALGEKDTTTVKKIVVALGEEQALRLFEHTRQKESEGGVMVLDGSRRRAPGGAFIFHFKEDTSIDKEVKDQIFADTEKQDRQWKKAKRRGRRPATFEDSLKEFSDKLKERHGMKDDDTEMMEDDSEKQSGSISEAAGNKSEKKDESIDLQTLTSQADMTVEPEVKEEKAKSALVPTNGGLAVEDFMGDEW